ncbi:P-loop containing nucleoside triphosphate hydrolase protein [Pseudoneurospora amorphoporcata]|uniref:P-loop containing nucleoside triphosphate hydrolase protein n=1 Tax=Pseudoneurospora amorphoporcata TaxID=241081 RepID=A0AAN6SD12_9PEZI|nr:P-loop containing nucleoside triphosphate hydrolase protein [Pseudoneurospora amorphoporcata]
MMDTVDSVSSRPFTALDPAPPLQTRIIDDKSPLCIPFILSKIAEYNNTLPHPFIIGLNGVQGVGKTTLVKALAETLQEREGLNTLVVSIDDFYLTHEDQLRLAEENSDNALVQYRGEPGTHDLPLLTSFLTSILSSQPTHLPRYDKSAHSGLGDRLPPSTFPPINDPLLSRPDHRNIRVLILEGWLTGFRSLPPSVIRQKYLDLKNHKTLSHHKLEHLLFINQQLQRYEDVWDQFDAFIHIDAQDLEWVYEWRLEQEEQMRREKGVGMSEDMVRKFVDGYFPAYELYEDGVRQGVFRGGESKKGRQLRIVVGRDRGVVEHMVI